MKAPLVLMLVGAAALVATQPREAVSLPEDGGQPVEPATVGEEEQPVDLDNLEEEEPVDLDDLEEEGEEAIDLDDLDGEEEVAEEMLPPPEDIVEREPNPLYVAVAAVPLLLIASLLLPSRGQRKQKKK
jgi:hypothetical protein